MRLNPPTLFVFLLSLLFAIFALVAQLHLLPIPQMVPHQQFWLVLVAYIMLMLGNLVRGL